MRRNRLHRLLGLGLALLGSLAALACRYSVRDTGFVDLGNSTHRLQLVAPPNLPTAARQAFERAAATGLADSSLAFETTPDGRPGEPALVRLFHADGATLPLGTLSADGANAPDLVLRATASPLRERLLAECLRAYAVVLLLESSDPAANQRARTAAENAAAATTRLLPSMPKPVSTGPQILSLDPATQSAEAVALWSLGASPSPLSQPEIILVYGRGRRLGNVLQGPLITETALRERLVLVGQDCECELDRAWLKGPLLAARWDETLQASAAKSLGFDPENPGVRSEVSRIVERGPQPGQRRKIAGTAQALGYSEEPVDSRTDTPPEDAHPHPTPGVASPTIPHVATPAIQVPSGIPKPIQPSEPVTPRRPVTRRLWAVLAGLAAALVTTGAWVAWRSRSR